MRGTEGRSMWALGPCSDVQNPLGCWSNSGPRHSQTAAEGPLCPGTRQGSRCRTELVALPAGCCPWPSQAQWGPKSRGAGAWED